MNRAAIVVLVCGACASRYKVEHVGSGAVGGAGVTVAEGSYRAKLAFEVPRAQVVAWTVTCGGHEVARGEAGETFEAYRVRRLAELTKKRQDEAELAAMFVPHPPGVKVEIKVAPVTELPAGEVGGGRLEATAEFDASAGACAIAADAAGSYDLASVRDLDAEKRQKLEVVRDGAVTARARVFERLVAFGADETIVEGRRAIVEARVDGALRVRQEMTATLIASGATLPSTSTSTSTGTSTETSTGATVVVPVVPVVRVVVPVRVIVKPKR